MKSCQKLRTPLTISVRHMAIGYNYKMNNKRCWFDQKEPQESVVKIPFRERPENLSRKDKWHIETVENIFEKHHTIITFHMMYKPRDVYEQKLDWDLLAELSGTSVKGNSYPKHCVLNFLRRSKFVHMIPLFQHNTGILYTNDINEVQAICKALKKSQYKKHLMLGGLINGQLVGPNTLHEIAELDDLQTEQAKLVGLLSTASVELVQTLSQPSALLSLVLEQRGKEEGG